MPNFVNGAKNDIALIKLRRRRNTLLKKRKYLSQKSPGTHTPGLSQTKTGGDGLLGNPSTPEPDLDTLAYNQDLFIFHQNTAVFQDSTGCRGSRHGVGRDRQQRDLEDLRHLRVSRAVPKSSITHGNQDSTRLLSPLASDRSRSLQAMHEQLPGPSGITPNVILEGASSSTRTHVDDTLGRVQKQALEGAPIADTTTRQFLILESEFPLSSGAKDKHDSPTDTVSPDYFASADQASLVDPSWPGPPRFYTSLADSLKVRLSPSAVVDIDSSLAVDFDATVPELQQQIYQICEKLKNSYPKIDALPYDVWTSSSRSTLRTWLRILVGKWQTRFDDVPRRAQANGPESEPIDHAIREVLDDMVRCHGLDGEAARRMATRWLEVFGNRNLPEISRQADEENLEWEEVDAGLSWLRDRQYGKPEAEPTSISVSSGKMAERDTILQAARVRRGTSRGLAARFARHYSTNAGPRPGNHRSIGPERTMSASDDVSEPTESTDTTSVLPHLTRSGAAHMVSVSTKPHTIRRAIAVGTVHFSNTLPVKLIRDNSVKKGDVLSVSRIAGIMAAKKCPDLIPLCHPILLTSVGVELSILDTKNTNFGGIMIEAEVQCEGQTGVEMEALTAVMGSALSVVDMCKAVDKGMRIDGVRVVLKEGGKSGLWKE